MVTDNEKSELFIKAINAEAEKRCDSIKKDIDNYINSELQKARELAHTNVRTVKKDETDRLNEQNNATFSELEAEETGKLLNRRNEIANEVFANAVKKINGFTESGEYISFLEKSIGEIKKAIGEDAVIILRPDDKKYEEKLKSLCAEIKYDSSIVLGGCKAENIPAALIADDTLDSRLKEAKVDFYKNSGLTITL